MRAAARKNFSLDEPEPIQCRKCDGIGRLWFDSCSTCEGTGSVFHVRGKTFPNTILGYMQAEHALREVKPHD